MSAVPITLPATAGITTRQESHGLFVWRCAIAGPWIKIEYATPDKVEIARIAKKLGIHRLHAFGLCFEFWRWCDAHLQNGHICDFCLDDVDKKVHHIGFGTALSEVGWLLIEDDRVIVTNFDRHLGQSAKTRADAAKRQATSRAKAPSKRVSRK